MVGDTLDCADCFVSDDKDSEVAVVFDILLHIVRRLFLDFVCGVEHIDAVSVESIDRLIDRASAVLVNKALDYGFVVGKAGGRAWCADVKHLGGRGYFACAGGYSLGGVDDAVFHFECF